MKKISFFLVALLLTLSAGAQTLRGDVNGDGIVNIGDVTDLVNIILYGDEEEPDTPVVPEEPAITTGEAIDLGLPSGLKWASCNVGATAPEEYGGYYAWGETEEESNYDWSTYKYCKGSYYTLTKYCTNSNFGTVDNKTTLEPEDDVAHVKWGGSWRMPTLDEIKELGNNCTWTRTTLNSVHGYRVTGPNGNSIFLPAAGYRDGTGVYYQGAYGYYWSSSLRNYYNFGACLLYFDSSYNFSEDYSRYYGHSVRPVCGTSVSTSVNYTVNVTSEAGGSALTSNGGTSITIAENNNVTITATADAGYTFAGWYNGETLVSTETTYTFLPSENITLTAKFTPAPPPGEAIDLGLPSGLKWASCNVGATAPEEYGGYYAWGETEEKSNYDWSTYKYCNGSSTTLTKYCTKSSYGTVDNKTTLEPEDDVAHVQWGGSWRMPTLDEIKELGNNCTWTKTTLNSVHGYRVTGPNGNSIFLPAAGHRDGEEVYSQGAYGYYWSSTLYSDYSYFVFVLYFNSSFYDWSYIYRYYGYSVRPVSE